METLKQLKETAELRISDVIETLNAMSSLYGIEKITEAIVLLQEARVDLSLNLELNLKEIKK